MNDFEKLGTTWFPRKKKMTVPEEQEAILRAEPKRRLKKKEIEDRTKALIQETIDKLFEEAQK